MKTYCGAPPPPCFSHKDLQRVHGVVGPTSRGHAMLPDDSDRSTTSRGRPPYGDPVFDALSAPVLVLLPHAPYKGRPQPSPAGGSHEIRISKGSARPRGRVGHRG